MKTKKTSLRALWMVLPVLVLSSVASAQMELTRVNSINLEPRAEAPGEERIFELRETSSAGKSSYVVRRRLDGREMRENIPAWTFKQIQKDMSEWFKTISAATPMPRMIACKKPVSMMQDSKSYPLCLDGLDEKQTRELMAWYSDVNEQVRSNEW